MQTRFQLSAVRTLERKCFMGYNGAFNAVVRDMDPGWRIDYLNRRGRSIVIQATEFVRDSIKVQR